MDIKVYFLILAWIAYFLVHSLLAKNSVKRALGLSPKNHRLLYSLVAIITFVLPLYFMVFHAGPKLLPVNNVSKFFGLAFTTYGFLLIRLAFRQLSFKVFVGLKENQDSGLITTGIFSKIRHPINAGTLLLILGFAVFSLSLAAVLTAICWWIYIFMAIPVEEKRLLDTYGEEYRKYMERVPRLLPKRLW
jgi:methanethiol S-methyltransferase